MAGTWTTSGDEVTLRNTTGPKDCTSPARYAFTIDGARVGLSAVADDCKVRHMILNGSQWLPPGTSAAAAARRIVLTPGPVTGALPAANGIGHWPSFRGREASGVADSPSPANGQSPPERWNPATGENILWKTTIPGLSHSSPIVWGDVIFVTSAISGRKDATFKPGLYGDGDASEDRSEHRWMLYALDRTTGKIRWERTAAQGPPRNKRHIKSTYASASPATDGRIVVAWFGSQGLFAYDVDGGLRWSVDLGRVDMGAYDIPSYRVGAGQLADHLEWSRHRAVRHTSGFVSARARCRDRRHGLENAAPGTAVVGHADDRQHAGGTGVDHQRVEFRARLRPENRQGAVAAWRQLEDYGAHADLRRAACTSWPAAARRSGRSSRCKPGARGDLTLAKGATANTHVAWSKTGRGSYMPTPLAYAGCSTCWPTTACSMPTISRLARKSTASDCRLSAAASARPLWRPTARSTCRTKTARCWSIEAGETFKHIGDQLDGRDR